jgi:hypothetical protein
MRPGGILLIVSIVAILAVVGVSVVPTLIGGERQTRITTGVGSGLPSEFFHTYREGDHYLEGYVTLPNSCFRMTQTSTISTGTPPLATIFLNAREITSHCVPLITREPVNLRLTTASDALIQLRLNGEPLAATITEVSTLGESNVSEQMVSSFRYVLGTTSEACNAPEAVCAPGWVRVSSDGDECYCDIAQEDMGPGLCRYLKASPCESTALCDDDRQSCSDQYGCGCVN